MQNWRILSKNFFADLIFFYFFHFQTFVDVMMYFHEKLQNALKIKDSTFNVFDDISGFLKTHNVVFYHFRNGNILSF